MDIVLFHHFLGLWFGPLRTPRYPLSLPRPFGIVVQKRSASPQLVLEIGGSRRSLPATHSPSANAQRDAIAFGTTIDVGHDPGCVKTCAHEKRAELFSLLSCLGNLSPALLFFKSTEVETKFPFANSVRYFHAAKTHNGSLRPHGMSSIAPENVRSWPRVAPPQIWRFLASIAGGTRARPDR